MASSTTSANHAFVDLALDYFKQKGIARDKVQKQTRVHRSER